MINCSLKTRQDAHSVQSISSKQAPLTTANFAFTRIEVVTVRVSVNIRWCISVQIAVIKNNPRVVSNLNSHFPIINKLDGIYLGFWFMQ